MLGNLSGWHFLIIIAVVVLLFGAPKLPGLAKSLGQSLRIFKGEMKQMKDDTTDAKTGEKATSAEAAGNTDASKNS